LLVNTIYADITNVRMTDTPGGAAVTQFASGTSVVYVVFDYSDVQNDEIRVRVYDSVDNVLFEQVKVYTGSGTESIAISPEVEAFADGRYLTNLYSGLFPIGTIIWDVTPVTGEATHTPALTPASAQPMPTLVPGQPTPTCNATDADTDSGAANGHSHKDIANANIGHSSADSPSNAGYSHGDVTIFHCDNGIANTDNRTDASVYLRTHCHFRHRGRDKAFLGYRWLCLCSSGIGPLAWLC